MADVQPLRALHYDQAVAGPLQALVAPPYDVIDPEQRAHLAARSPYNAVRIDLPEAGAEADPYAAAAAELAEWRAAGAVVQDPEPALWALEQDYTGPDGRARTRRGILARVRVTDYGPGQIRPHERTHPGPKEDRLRLTRATRANLSPIFSLHAGDAYGALAPEGAPWGEATDEDGTHNRLWRVADPDRVAAAREVLARAELLIADGHHRYETARVYAEEVGGEGPHRYVLMCLVSLEDPGLTVFPTHRLLDGLKEPAVQERLGATLKDLFHVEQVAESELRPPDAPHGGPVQLGYMDGHFRTPYRLTLKDPAVADRALAHMPEAYRRLDTAVLETLVLTGPVGLTEDDIAHLRGLGYSRTDAEAVELIRSGRYDAGFFLRSTPVEQVREVAAAGVTMPPKSTFFFPKVPTGLLFHLLD